MRTELDRISGVIKGIDCRTSTSYVSVPLEYGNTHVLSDISCQFCNVIRCRRSCGTGPCTLVKQSVKAYADYGDSQGSLLPSNYISRLARVEPELKAGDDVSIKEKYAQKAQWHPVATGQHSGAEFR